MDFFDRQDSARKRTWVFLGLYSLTPDRGTDFRDRIDTVVEETETSLYQICIREIVVRHLDRQFGKLRPAKRQIFSISSRWDEISVLLAALARAGEKDIDRAWRAAISTLRKPFHAVPRPRKRFITRLEPSTNSVRASFGA